MIEMKFNNYQDLLYYLNDDHRYTIEKFIPNVELETIKLGNYLIEVLNDKVNKCYYNLHCIRTNVKDLNGIAESICHDIGNLVFKKYNKSFLKRTYRVKLTEENYYKYKNRYKIIVVKNADQLYYENNIIWDHIKII